MANMRLKKITPSARLCEGMAFDNSKWLVSGMGAFKYFIEQIKLIC